MTGFVALTGSFWHLCMVLMVPAPSTFVFGVIVARTKSTTLIVSRINLLYKFSILILGKHLYLNRLKPPKNELFHIIPPSL